jgi:polyisoprenyl-teichoic acid--peptidoglycan teichoic acid transferase
VVLLGMHNRNDDNSFGEIYFIDTILVASINFEQNALTLLAVPRDAYVSIANTGTKDRIRQSYSYGYKLAGGDSHQNGLRYVLDTVSSTLNEFELHYFVAIDMEGLRQLIDSMGGVYYDVEEDMIGFTPQESRQAGPQVLDGRGYLNYLAYREPDARDDLNRIARQKTLLLATFDFFQEQGLFNYVIPVYDAYRDHIYTDLSFNQVAALALFAGERLEADAISDYSLKGEYYKLNDGTSFYFAIDEITKNNILNEFGGFTGE